MRSFKKLGILVAVFALCAIGAASASAGEFTAEETGEIDGKALNTQVFTTSGGEVKCTSLDVTGSITEVKSLKQHATVQYTGCTAFGIPAHVSPATYLFTSSGEVHVKNTITITVTIPFFPDCHVTVGPQSLNTVDYANSGNNVKLTATVGGIVYTTSGSGCGAGGNSGTYEGASEVTLKSGKKVSFDP